MNVCRNTKLLPVQILAVRSFETDNDVILNQYTKYFTDFFTYSRSQGKSKLIIDLSGNPGGSAVLRYDFSFLS